ncbi:type II secretion system F family protein [Rugamonas apoptosis]|uniref:Type II secretion system F family protein n=1 Tax=Rugamonas apoptosis TaxID=2758570 RepID=A0A7W2F600_9BURK|nr:type II secretion system F family protein [Rugamonas apoptosis]MBA5685736.1 type II secretion system F family protein [Rugamonas apoptosis]
MDMFMTGFAVLLFAAVILAIEGSWLWWSGSHGGGARRIAQRLRLMAGGAAGNAQQLSILKQRRYAKAPALERLLRRVPQLAALDRLLSQAGLSWSVAQFLGGTASTSLAGMVLPLFWDLPLPAMLVALAAGLLLPGGLALRARAARLKKIEQQLPEAADFLGRALRAGHSFANVLQMAGDEMPDPIAAEFRFAHREINYGVPMNEALHNLATRVPLTDLRYLVIAVLIQRESGGNLAEILGSISRLIRARLKLLGQVRVMSAEGRLSAWILGLLPIGVLLVMTLLNPEYVRPLWHDPTGVRLMWWAGGVSMLGVFWMRSLIHIRV